MSLTPIQQALDGRSILETIIIKVKRREREGTQQRAIEIKLTNVRAHSHPLFSLIDEHKQKRSYPCGLLSIIDMVRTSIFLLRKRSSVENDFPFGDYLARMFEFTADLVLPIGLSSLRGWLDLNRC